MGSVQFFFAFLELFNFCKPLIVKHIFCVMFPLTDPSSVDLHIDGETDACSKSEDINFRFTGFGVVGKVCTVMYCRNA